LTEETVVVDVDVVEVTELAEIVIIVDQVEGWSWGP
jgi:hypothetical protein